jgi:hypothetical protein
MNIDPERTTCNVVIQISDMNVVVKDVGKGSIVIGNLVVVLLRTLMRYSLFKKLGGSEEELIKTNMIVSGVEEAILLVLKESLLWSSPLGPRHLPLLSSSLRCKVTSV